MSDKKSESKRNTRILLAAIIILPFFLPHWSGDCLGANDWLFSCGRFGRHLHSRSDLYSHSSLSLFPHA